MPIDGWDHVELWVGNAKQSAYFYEHAFGFAPVAYAGPETGVRDRASYVLGQGDIRFVFTTALREEHEIARHAVRHGDGVKDIALTVPSLVQHLDLVPSVKGGQPAAWGEDPQRKAAVFAEDASVYAW